MNDVNIDAKENPNEKIKNSNKKIKILGALAEFTVYILFIWTDVEVILPRSHVGACLVFFFATSAPIYFLFFKEEIVRLALYPGTCLIVAFCCTLLYAYVGPTPMPEPEIGWLQPAGVATPPNACSHLSKKNDVVVLYGRNASFYTKGTDAMSKHTILRIGDCPSLVVKSDQEGVYIDAYIFDKDGNLLGQIVNNKFAVKNDKSLHIERTGDLSTLIVHDSNDKELLYVKYLNENAFKIRGEFYCPIPLKGYFDAEQSNNYFYDNCSGNTGGTVIQIGPR